jgi:hypothetical protein
VTAFLDAYANVRIVAKSGQSKRAVAKARDEWQRTGRDLKAKIRQCKALPANEANPSQPMAPDENLSPAATGQPQPGTSSSPSTGNAQFTGHRQPGARFSQDMATKANFSPAANLPPAATGQPQLGTSSSPSTGNAQLTGNLSPRDNSQPTSPKSPRDNSPPTSPQSPKASASRAITSQHLRLAGSPSNPRFPHRLPPKAPQPQLSRAPARPGSSRLLLSALENIMASKAKVPDAEAGKEQTQGRRMPPIGSISATPAGRGLRAFGSNFAPVNHGLQPVGRNAMPAGQPNPGANTSQHSQLMEPSPIMSRDAGLPDAWISNATPTGHGFQTVDSNATPAGQPNPGANVSQPMVPSSIIPRDANFSGAWTSNEQAGGNRLKSFASSEKPMAYDPKRSVNPWELGYTPMVCNHP